MLKSSRKSKKLFIPHTILAHNDSLISATPWGSRVNIYNFLVLVLQLVSGIDVLEAWGEVNGALGLRLKKAAVYLPGADSGVP